MLNRVTRTEKKNIYIYTKILRGFYQRFVKVLRKVIARIIRALFQRILLITQFRLLHLCLPVIHPNLDDGAYRFRAFRFSRTQRALKETTERPVVKRGVKKRCR